jgi:flagellin
MNSILNNSAALSALQSLAQTQQSLNTVQKQVSTGLSVANASDNSSYWSIAQQLGSDSGVVTASQSALSEGQSVLSTATSAINSVITTLKSMATQLTQAQNPGAVIGDINTSLASLSQQLTDAVNGASFNGLNILNGTQTTMNFVSGFNASSTGGSLNTISFAAQALTGGSETVGTTSTTSVTSSTTIKALQGLASQASPATFGTDQVQFSGSATSPEQLTVTSVDASGNTTSTVYTARDSNGKVIDGGNFASDSKIASLSATTTVTPTSSTATSTTSTSTVSDASTVAELQSVATNSVAIGSASYGKDAINVTQGTATSAATVEIQSVDLYGNTTTTTYTAADANGNALVGTGSQAAAAKFNAVTTFTPASSTTTNLLTQDGIDVTGGTTGTFQIGGSNGYTAAGMLAAVQQSLSAVQNYSAQIGATQDRMTAASNFNSDLTTNYSNGVAGLVDADMNTASTQLQALQTQEQLGIQSLSIANQNASLILKLFS